MLLSMDSAFSCRSLAYISDLVPKTPTRTRIRALNQAPKVIPFSVGGRCCRRRRSQYGAPPAGATCWYWGIGVSAL